jgi:hypothetical protein
MVFQLYRSISALLISTDQHNLFVPDEVAAFFIDDAFTKTQAAGLSVRINQFMAAFH